LKTKFGGKKRREIGDVCGRERERGSRFVIKKKKKEKERRAKEEERESKRSRGGERAAFGQNQVSTTLSVF
jgi:hypothetical protein